MNDPWRQRALVALDELARSGDEFDSDDLIARVGVPDERHHHNGRNSAIGSVFRECHARGLIEPTGGVRQSRQPRRKGGLIRLWRGARKEALF
jgi:hypothetical protein